MKRALKYDFVRFCVVGAIGFIINFALLSLLYKIWGWPIFIAQLIASEVSLFNNFLLHNNWTYKRNNVKKTLPRLLIEFHATSWIAIVGSSALVSFGVHVLDLHYAVALIIASIIVMVWNFGWTKLYVWKHNDIGESEGQ